MIRGLKGLLALGALAGLGLALRWVTAGAVGAATAEDLTSMASLAVGAVAWVAYAWLLVAVLATVLEQVPGVVGRAASTVSARITSQGARTLLRSTLGVAAVAPLTFGVAHATPGDSPADWRATEKASSLQLNEQPARTTNPGTGRVAVPKKPAQLGRPGEQRVGVPDRPTQGAPTRYTDVGSGQPVRPSTRAVAAGDSLWALASAELGPNATDATVAARWPQWYAANHAVIGSDPDLILPGQVLRIPAPAVQPVPPTHQEK
jgi:nucleoid-associated protein YgaU